VGLANHIRSDGELVARARQGCQESFGELVDRHYQTCVHIASFVLGNRADALDEVQKAWCSAFTHLNQYRGEAEFSTWILRIVVNQCRTLLRGRKRAQILYIDAKRGQEQHQVTGLAAPGAGPEEEVMARELRDMLQRQIRRIPPVFATYSIYGM
jgi:RNA polymerase sigma-70 factor (ECF subfamily)